MYSPSSSGDAARAATHAAAAEATLLLLLMECWGERSPGLATPLWGSRHTESRFESHDGCVVFAASFEL